MPDGAAVVVIARDAAATLPATLEALAGEDVVVVDNASRDATAAVALAHGARVVREPVPGRARARNAGIAAVTGDVLFTDADCVPRPGWAAALRAGLAGHALCGGPIALTAGPGAGALARLDAAWRYRDPRPALEAGWWATANLGVRREVLDAVGGFRAALPHVGEDVDLCLRARAAGFDLGWAPQAVVDHAVEARLRPWLRRAYERGFSQDALHVHHGLPADVVWRHPGGLLRGGWALRDLGLDPAAHHDLRWAARLWRLGRGAGALHGRLSRRRYGRPG